MQRAFNRFHDEFRRICGLLQEKLIHLLALLQKLSALHHELSVFALPEAGTALENHQLILPENRCV